MGGVGDDVGVGMVWMWVTKWLVVWVMKRWVVWLLEGWGDVGDEIVGAGWGAGLGDWREVPLRMVVGGDKQGKSLWDAHVASAQAATSAGCCSA